MRLVLALFLLLGSVSWADMTTINRKGGTVDVESRLVPDRENIVVFHHKSTYLSHQLYTSLGKLSARRKDLPILIVEVPNLDSPVARQYRLQTVPYVRIYDAKGKLKSEGSPAYKAVIEMTEN